MSTRTTLNRLAKVGLAGLLTIGLLTSCGAPKTSTDQTADPSSKGSNIAHNQKSDLKIGVIQFIEHPSLDQAYNGFVSELEKNNYVQGKNLSINLVNAQGEQANCQTIAGQFATSNYDMILAIATPSAQAVANVIHDKPILVTAVTDLVAARLVDSNEKPGGNITGTSDMTPIDDQIQLARTLLPNAKKLGIIYSSGEVNSELQAKAAEKSAQNNGFEVQTVTISSTNEIQQVTESIIDQVDVIYLPADNALASSIATVAQIAIQHQKPIMPAVESMCAEGGLASVSINYTQLGAQTARMALKIIDDHQQPNDLPVEFLSNPELVINETFAEAIGYQFPPSIKEKARIAKLD